MSRSLRAATVILGAAGALALAAPAGALPTITSSQVTTPSASPTYLTYDADNPNTFAVAGNVTSPSPGSETVDIRCYSGDQGGSILIASNLTVQPDGTFSDPAAPLPGLQDGPCRLRAVPTGVTDNEPSFAGPLLVVDSMQTTKLTGPPNNGVSYDFNIQGNELGVADSFSSAGDCPFGGGLLDTAYGFATRVFSCAAQLASRNLDGTLDTRSEAQVDGVDAYPPDAAEQAFSGADATPGMPALSYSATQNPSTGALTVEDSEPLARCPVGTPFPPTAATCTSFSPTGVQLNRTISQSGHLVAITDSYTSTDGDSHSLDLLYQNGVNLAADSFGYQPNIGYEFPGQSSYAPHARGDAVSVPAGPGMILIKNLAADDGDPFTGQAAVTYDISPSQILFISPASTGASDFTMHYVGTVPAVGALTYKFVYAQDFTTAAVTSEALSAEDAFVSPSVKISIPRNGEVSHSPNSDVTGIATDLVGISSLTVNGKAVAVYADGSFSTPVTLKTGANTFTVLAKNTAGNSTTVSVEITYKPLICKVPKLAGKSLSAARTALRKANCMTGKVTRRHSGTVRAGRVISSNPKSGGRHKAGTKVALAVSQGL